MFNLNSPGKPRVIRVFISSTFLDMKDERERLVKHTFTQLRRKAQEHGVVLTDIDLRWGINEEQACRGETLARCLVEVERSKPYFIGILGHRYGWVPRDPLQGESEEQRHDRLELLRRQLRRDHELVDIVDMVDSGMSATEIEMRYGVLRHSESHHRARFYFRSASPAEYAEAPDSPSAQRLRALKETLRGRLQLHPPQEFSSVDCLHQAVLADFERFLEEDYPLHDKPDALQATMSAHRDFARTRLNIWEGADERMDELDQAVDHGAPQILVTGPGGLGKTALLAHWIQLRQNPETIVFYAFCGGAPGASTWPEVLRFILSQVLFHFADLQKLIPIPQQDSELSAYLRQALTLASTKGEKIVLVLDGLDQLRDASETERWPEQLPEGIQVVLGIREGTVADRFRSRGLPVVEMRQLDVRDRKDIIRKLQDRIGKNLGLDLIRDIAEDKESGNPLVLRTLLEELRSHGSHEDLHEVVHGYIDTNSYEEFFGKVVERIARDYAPQKADMVLSLLGVSITGLTEDEIREAAELETHLDWSELHDVLAPHLVDRNGYLAFNHDFFRTAVASALYIPTPDQARRNLAEYFLAEERRLSQHSLQEWPWLLRLLGERERMEALLRQGKVCAVLLKLDMKQAHNHWLWLAEVQASSADWIAQSAKLWVEEEDLEDLERFRGYLTNWVGRPGAATEIGERIIEERSRKQGPDALDTILAKGNLAITYSSMNRHVEALKLKEQVLEQRTRLLGPDALDTISAKGNLAGTYYSVNRHEEALKLNEQVLEQFTRLLGPDALNTIKAKGNLAITYSSMNRHEEALKLKEQVLEQQTRLLGPDALHTILAKYNLALTYSSMNRHEDALKLNEQVLEQRTQLLGPDALDTISAKGSLASTYSSMNRYAEALKLEEQVLEQRTRLLGPDALDTISAKGNLAGTYSSMNRHEEALKLEEQVLEQRTRLLGLDALDTISAKGNLAGTYSSMNRHEDALKLNEQVLEQRTRLLGPDALHTISAKCNLALTYSSMNRHEDALKLNEQVLEQRTRLLGPDARDTISAKCNLASTYSSMNRYVEALKLEEQVLEQRTRLLGPDARDTISAKGNLALTYSSLNRHAEALKLNEQVLELFTQLLGPDAVDTISAKYNLAISYYSLSNLEEALKLFEEAHTTLLRSYRDHPMNTQLAHAITVVLSRINPLRK